MRRGRLLDTLWVAGVLCIGGSRCGNSEAGGSVQSPADGSGGASSKPGSQQPGDSASAQGGGRAGHSNTSGDAEGKGESTAGSGGRSAGGTGGAMGSGGASGPGNVGGGRAGGGLKSDAGAAGSSVTGGAGGARATTGGSGAAGTGTGKDAGPDSAKDAGSSGKGGGGGTGGGGTCVASKDAGKSVSGTGPHKVVIESNADSGVSCGTIYRPADLGGNEKYPIFVWGEGGCSRSGTSNQAAMGEIASHGYFVIADGPVGSAGNCGSISMSTDVEGMAKVMIGYIDWAMAENEKPCSAYYGSLDTTKVAADGFSCGGLMAEGTAGDARMTAVGITSSGLTSAVPSYYKKIHTPFKILLGGSDDIAYENGEKDYDQISALGIPVLLLSKEGAGHGGDLSRGTGDFNSVNLAWLNWQLKGDLGATGKGALWGSTCKYCSDSAWEYKSKNIQ